jgi:hypothetical protein
MVYKRTFMAGIDERRLAGYLDDDLVPDSISRQLLGNVSRMTFWRWQQGSVAGFPQAVLIGKRNYRKAGQLRQFLRTLSRS